MKFNESAVREGGVYVYKNEISARIVDAILDGRVYFRSFTLPEGKYYAQNIINMETFLYWAGREATPDEVSKLDFAGEDQLARHRWIMDIFLHHATDEELITEIEIRGRTLEHSLTRASYERMLAEARRRGLIK